MVQKYLLLFLCLSLVQGMPKDPKKWYFEEAEKCLKLETPSGAVHQNGQFVCEPFLKQGSKCHPGEWLILRKHPLFEWYPECVQKKCGPIKPVRRVPFRAVNGECKDLGDPEPCENGEVVRHTVYGYGNCSRVNFEGEFDGISNADSDLTESFSAVGVVLSNCNTTDTRGQCVTTIFIEPEPVVWWDK